MKKTGDICKVDALGRIVIPVKLRRALGLETNVPLEVLLNDDQIILKKYIPVCIFCGTDEKLVSYKSKYVCEKCAKEITNNN